MKKRLLSLIFFVTIALTGCVSSTTLGTLGWDGTVSENPTIFRNTLSFKNTTPYCTAQVLAGKIEQSPYQEVQFNPVKKSFVLHKGGGSHFIEHTFNTTKKYATKINWYDRHGNFLNAEYIASGAEYQYVIEKRHMGTQVIPLSNKQRGECWERERRIHIDIHQP